MKKVLLFAVLLIAAFSARAQHIYCIETCPAENTSKEMNISWAMDTVSGGSYVIYTEASDKKWKHSKSIEPKMHLCSTFDSIYSKNADNKDFYERHIFYKCGVTLPHLKSNTKYMYRVMTTEKEQSDIHYFKTAGSQNWSCAIISDFHAYAPLPKRTVAAMTMLDTIMAKDPDVDWILHLGDVIAWGGSYSYWQKLYEEPYFSKYMWAGINGNHDNMSRKYTKCTNDYFRNVNHYPQNGYGDEVGVCYYFYYGDALFIMLNNEDMRSAEGLAEAQQWFENVVNKEQGKFRYLIVCEHYQWFYGGNGRASQYNRWKEMFDKYGVDLALAGNNHIYVRSQALKEDLVTDGTSGTVYIQSASSDNERGNPQVDSISENQDKIVKVWNEGPHTVGAMLLDATVTNLTVTLYDRYGTEVDQVKIPSKR